MSCKTILSSPFLFTAMAGVKGQVKNVVRGANGSVNYPSVLKGDSKVARVAMLSKVYQVQVAKPCVELLATPSLLRASALRHDIITYPKGTFHAKYLGV